MMEESKLSQERHSLYENVAVKRPINWDDATSNEESKRSRLQNSELPTIRDTPSAADEGMSLDQFKDEHVHEERQSILENTTPVNPDLQYDACFGVVIVPAISSFQERKGTARAALNVTALGNMIKLSSKSANKYSGIITNPAISKLIKEFQVQLEASLVMSDKPQRKVEKKLHLWVEIPQDCLVRLIIYGQSSQSRAVGKMLGNCGLFLQHPFVGEWDSQVKYINPHYLLRPGSDMPRLDELSFSSDSKTNGASQYLDEVTKSRFIHILDQANDLGSLLQLEPSNRLRSQLKDHQRSALSRLVDVECGTLANAKSPTLWELLPSNGDQSQRYRHKITGAIEFSPQPTYGGVLADEMGLGKTVSLLALICWSLDLASQQEAAMDDEDCGSTLIVTPKSTIHNWQHQIKEHTSPGKINTVTYHGSNRKALFNKKQHFDILLTTYETMRADWSSKGPLFSRRWLRVVLDEAHHIRNRTSQSFQAACSLQAQYRWCLTGTPIQNSLDDYGALLAFLRVSMMDTKSAFDFWICKPIKENLPDSLYRLGDLVKATCLRRTKHLVSDSLGLPPRIQRVEWIELSSKERRLYQFFQKKTAETASGLARREREYRTTHSNILTLINLLRRICDHGKDLLPPSALEVWKTRKEVSVDWEEMQASISTCETCGASLENVQETDFPTSIALGSQIEEDLIDSEYKCSNCALDQTSNQKSPTRVVKSSSKVSALIKNIRDEQGMRLEEDSTSPIKSIVFSSWTKMLDLVQSALVQNGFILQRIDGQTSLKRRIEAIHEFNEDPRCTVMLATIGSAGEGVDFTAASNVHLLEPHWNPMAEAQAVDRVHRIGQTRDVAITRYVTKNSIETWVQSTQKSKLQMISESLDSTDVSRSKMSLQQWKKLRLNLGCEDRE